MFVNELHQGGIRALLDYDNTLFDNMVVPDGVSLADVVDNIIFKCGDTPLFCPEPAVMKYYLGKWSAKRLDQWKRYQKALELEYDPISNYDRIEEHEDSFTHGHNVETDDDLKSSNNVENLISADNSSKYQADNKGIETGSDIRDISEKHSGTDLRKINSRIHGNIGVTTSQQMLTSELELIPELNLVDYITEDFKIEFCLYIY